MAEPFITRGFKGRRREAPGLADRIPPGQHLVDDFPVLSAGPTPRTPLAAWDLTLVIAGKPARRWTWDEFRALPHEQITADIHCVTTWTKLDTHWEGVAVDTLLGFIEPRGAYVIAYCDGGYTTNIPLADVTGGKAWIVSSYDDAPLPPEHGGPARLLVPHLYLWKSAKWIRGLELVDADRPGFWESLGYNNRGDPWLEQRYHGD